MSSSPVLAGHINGETLKPAEPQFMVKIAKKVKGKDRDRLIEDHGLEALTETKDPESGDRLLLVRPGHLPWSDPDSGLATLRLEKHVVNAEEVLLAALPESFDDVFLDQSTMAILGALENRGTARLGSNPSVWDGYVSQQAALLLELNEARQKATGKGIVVAIIDTGIDPTHEILAPQLVDGYDFLLNQEGDAHDGVLLDQSTMAILGQTNAAMLDQSTMAILGQSTMAILGQSTMAILGDVELPHFLGHGTLVAGIVHLTAPDAALMPLRVFDGEGLGTTFDIVRAIYYAVEHGAHVINMSFHLDVLTAELREALEMAERAGVIVVAASGNHGLDTIVYPAGFNKVIGVAATDDADFVADFSNVGRFLVDIAAPGVSVISTFTGGGWAAASGTSYAAPWISGAAALLQERNTSLDSSKGGKKKGSGAAVSLNPQEALQALRNADPVLGPDSDLVGYGRANVAKAVEDVK